MDTFQQARKRHLVVSDAARQNEGDAAALWNAIVGVGDDLPPLSYAEAVRDTLPQDQAPLLASNAVAASCAFGRHTSYIPVRAAPVELRDQARRSWAQFIELAKELEKLATGFGWDLSQAWEVQADVNLAQGSMAEVQRVAELAGRMYAAIRGENANRIAGMGGEIYSVEQGNNIGRLLPSEQVLLMEPLFELVVLERIATRRALQYAVRGTNKASRGPMVVLLDESGSMRGARNSWAKAAALAVARVAKEERRPFVAVHFSTSQVVKTVDPNSPTDVFALVRHFLNGGTHVGMALSTGLDEVEKLEGKGQRGADLILVTDGIDPDVFGQEREVKRAKEKNVRLWTIAIECEIPESSTLRKDATGYLRLGGAQLTQGDGGAFLASTVRP